MSSAKQGASRVAWALAGLAILPYALSAGAIWCAPPPIDTRLAPWTLCLYAALVVGGVGLLRLRLATRRNAVLEPAVLAVAILSPVTAIAACALAPWIGFRWAFMLQVAALAVQGLWDVGGDAMPSLLRRMRPVVSGAGLVCLLVGLIGA